MGMLGTNGCAQYSAVLGEGNNGFNKAQEDCENRAISAHCDHF